MFSDLLYLCCTKIKKCVRKHPIYRTYYKDFCKYYVLVAQLKYTKNLYKNWIFRKFKYARKEEFYAPVICFG